MKPIEGAKADGITDDTLAIKLHRLEQELAELKAQLEPDYKVGDWVIWEGIQPSVGRIYKPCSSFNGSWWLRETYGYDEKDSHTSCDECNLRKATDEEIEKHLRKEWARITKEYGWDDPDEAEIEGHADGINYICNDVFYDSQDDKLFTSMGCVYHDGKFATPKKRNKFFEWDVEYTEGSVRIGNTSYPKAWMRHTISFLESLAEDDDVDFYNISEVLDELKKLDL